MDLTSANVNSVFVYIGDVLIVTKATKQEHLNEVRKDSRRCEFTVEGRKMRECTRKH